MPSRRPARPEWFVALALLSAAGLLAAGLVSLWRAGRDARELAVAESERAALADARALRLELADPTSSRSLPRERRFALKGGELAVPPFVGWLAAPPQENPEAELPAAAWESLLAAERAAADGDAAAAAAHFAQARSLPTLSPRARSFLDLAEAWAAERRGDVALRDQRLEPLADFSWTEASAADGSARPFRSVIAGTVLLRARSSGTLDLAWLRLGLGQLDDAGRDALLDEIGARRWKAPWRAHALPSPAEPASADLSSDDASPPDVATMRQILRRVKPRVGALAAAGEPVVEGLERDVLVYWPEASGAEPRGSGAGVVIPFDELQRSDPRLMIGELPPEAIPVAPRLGLRADPAALADERGGFGLLAGLVVVLAGALALGLTLALRSVRREAALTRARSDFLTSVTHELKTPLASIRLFSEMLLEGRVASEEKRREYHRLLAGEAERLSTLIENVLDLGRLERGERALDVRAQELVEVVREMVDRFAPLAERDGIVVDARLPEAPLVARFDRGALAQSLLNLLDNARKYARAGRRVDVALGADDGRAELTVRDFGPGVPESERAAIFEPFVRGAQQEDGATPGLGLGLHLARSLLRAQGGELALAPPRDGGAGACFVATLPLANGAAP